LNKFFNQLNNIKAGRAKVKAYGEGGTVDALESARDYLREKYNDPEAGIPTKVATTLGLVPVDLARGFAKAIAAPARSMIDPNFDPESEAFNMAGYITTGGIGLSKAGLGPKGDVLGMGVVEPQASRIARAKSMGFTKKLYRGTTAVENKLQPSTGSEHGVKGVSTTNSPEWANLHTEPFISGEPASGAAPNVMPLLGKEGPFIDFFDLMDLFSSETGKDASNASELEITKFAKKKGYIGTTLKDAGATDDAGALDYRYFNPKDVRSRFDKFKKAKGGAVEKSQRALGAKLFGG